MIVELNERSREVFRNIVESYVETGAPVSSRTIARRSALNLSPASIRNVMSDLEEAGLLYAPHTSAGRLPTQQGMRFFVDGLLRLGALSEEERLDIERRCASDGRSVQEMLSQAGEALSGLSSCASLVLAPKIDSAVKHIEFVPLNEGRALVVLVTEDGLVENRIVNLPLGLPQSALIEASNFLANRMRNRTLAEAREEILIELETKQAQLDQLATRVVEAGIATWAGQETLIVRGHANLLDDVQALQDLERIRRLYDELESKREAERLLDLVAGADGVQIFIGTENKLFSEGDSSFIVSPFMNSRERVVGIIGVVGPTRINYSRIVPLVDYTAKMIGRLLG
ncbi:heat-inducible transcriptional repressor HrcA [Oceanibacterium hippocampi]|uniref:Heat-inducible transcription repressor HrcA n=1 Tax=Oceanibacterium hippocampi TaxID=745714 RepID=A0A1Y5RI19_9PROT|nr:heat-inducible transcriptional repressor HrcA [Oceanibacterium hippocampi]SLN18087.1 Heat-inducible transcription repressor HrcA [Oceanibacterium hippocampi]